MQGIESMQEMQLHGGGDSALSTLRSPTQGIKPIQKNAANLFS